MSAPEVYAFYSVKGGVGKSALAIAAALGFARRGRPVAVLDMDFMGTSLADALALCAPRLEQGSEGLRLQGPAQGYMSRAETLVARGFSAGTGSKGLAFLDALLLDSTVEFNPAALAWRHPDHERIRWYPSSPRLGDSVRAAGRILNEIPTDDLTDRNAKLVARIAESLGEGAVVIVDLPPALYGMPTLVARAFAQVPEVKRFVPILVSTPDRGDLYRSLEVYLDLARSLWGMRWLLNRNHQAVNDVRQQVRALLPAHMAASGVDQRLHDIGWSGEGLGRLYQVDQLALPDELTERVVSLIGGV